MMRLALGLAVVLVRPSSAQGPAEFSGAVPESPAFTYLSVSPARVVRPGAARDFALALLNGIDATGRTQQGFALEVSPWYLIPGYTIPLAAYQQSWLKFLFANTQLSLGTAMASGDSASTDLAGGLRLTLLDAGDPMRSRVFTQALGDSVLRGCAPPDPTSPTNPACVGEVTATRFAAWTAEHWNARRVSLAVAGGVRFVGSSLGNGEYHGARIWIGGSNPLGRSGQLLAQVEYTGHPAESGAAKFSALTYGARVLVGSPTFDGFVELLGDSRFATSDSTNDTSGSWSGGVEVRVARNLWISTGFGNRFSNLEEPDRVSVIANVRWGLASASRLNAMRQ